MAAEKYFIPIANGRSSSKLESFEGHTLIVPTVSHASVPQLATDLLLNAANLSLTKSGRLDVSGDLIPFVGPDDLTGLTTPLEVYTNHSRRLTVLQQRSPVIKSRKANFVRRLTSWIQKENFRQVLIVSSIDASLRRDDELNTPFVHALHEDDSPTTPTLLRKLQSTCPAWKYSHGQDRSEAETRHSHRLPVSTGLAGRLLDALSRSKSNEANQIPSIPTGVLLLFAAEGDNRADAHLVARTACRLLAESEADTLGTSTSSPHTHQNSFCEPASWAGVFGNAYDQRVYG
ncbi:unnamed protein product [Sympodiomycopsis kandeliae]